VESCTNVAWHQCVGHAVVSGIVIKLLSTFKSVESRILLLIRIPTQGCSKPSSSWTANLMWIQPQQAVMLHSHLFCCNATNVRMCWRGIMSQTNPLALTVGTLLHALHDASTSDNCALCSAAGMLQAYLRESSATIANNSWTHHGRTAVGKVNIWMPSTTALNTAAATV
jgi:hypothetical protein